MTDYDDPSKVWFEVTTEEAWSELITAICQQDGVRSYGWNYSPNQRRDALMEQWREEVSAD